METLTLRLSDIKLLYYSIPASIKALADMLTATKRSTTAFNKCGCYRVNRDLLEKYYKVWKNDYLAVAIKKTHIRYILSCSTLNETIDPLKQY